MEPDGEERPQISWSQEDVDDVDTEFASPPETPPPEDPDEDEYIAHEALWEAILGIDPSQWTYDTDKVSECNRSLADDALKNDAKYHKDLHDYYERIDELNDTLSYREKFSCFNIQPRFPYPRCLYLWHRDFQMTNTKPTSVRSRRFTEPDTYEYVSSELLQFFSMRFAGDFCHGETMSIYGFVAVRDSVDKLRNYIFNRSREHAQDITQDSLDLPLMPPARGISAPFSVIVEYSLKVKSNGGDASEEDGELIDCCFNFQQPRISPDVMLHKVRLFGPRGPLDTRFAFLRFAVEATIDVKVKRAMTGYSLSAVTASTCGYLDEIVLFGGSPPSRAPRENRLSSSVVAVASAVVAVELGCQLKLRFEIKEGHVRKSSHELFFTARKHKNSKGAIVLSRMFKLVAKVTWSTLGESFHSIFHSTRSLLGDPLGPCSFSR